jgi:hypothetical protein
MLPGETARFAVWTEFVADGGHEHDVGFVSRVSFAICEAVGVFVSAEHGLVAPLSRCQLCGFFWASLKGLC